MSEVPLERYHPLVPPYDTEDKVAARSCFFYLFGIAVLSPFMIRDDFWNMLDFNWARIECWTNYFSFYLAVDDDADLPSQRVGDVLRTLCSELINHGHFMGKMIMDPNAVSRSTKYWLYKGKADVTPYGIAEMMTGALASASTGPGENALNDLLEAAGMAARRVARTALDNIDKIVWKMNVSRRKHCRIFRS